MKMHKLTMLASLFLLSAIPLANMQAQASLRSHEFQVEFRYNAWDSPREIYSDLRRTARDACSPRTQKFSRMTATRRACVADLLGKAVAQIGKPEVIAMYDRYIHANRI